MSLPTTSPGSNTSGSGVPIVDGTSESGDITIDSVRDHMNASPIPPVSATSSTT